MVGLGLGLALVLGTGQPPRAVAAGKQDARPLPAQMSLEALGREYRLLRRVTDRPNRTQAELEDTAYWGGRMQRVMNELAARLGAKATPLRKLEATMGRPDEVVAPGAPTWNVERQTTDSTLYVYVWRHRDLLFFELHDGAVLRSGWWMPYE